MGVLSPSCCQSVLWRWCRQHLPEPLADTLTAPDCPSPPSAHEIPSACLWTLVLPVTLALQVVGLWFYPLSLLLDLALQTQCSFLHLLSSFSLTHSLGDPSLLLNANVVHMEQTPQ